ncbi:MAG TPA: protein-disulfide reductase DsbD domain-containing protein, partial [bacterium]|nr:protein-disulfide reductase DsbD domain-containing protein [bacterium]
MTFRLFALACLAFATAVPGLAETDSTQPHVSVEMIGADSTLQPGRPVTVGFHFKIDRGWHLYWQNPGDSGLAPEIIWDLPPGFTAGPVLWPTPQRLALPSLVDYGYRNDLLLMVPIQVPADAHPGAVIDLSAMVRWLVCDEICIPGRV